MSLVHRYRRIAYQALPISVATDLRRVRLGEHAEDNIKLKAIDNDVKNILLDEGYSEDDIDDMSPEEAKSIIDTILQKTPSVPADVKKEIKSIDKLVDAENAEVSSELSSLAAEKEEVSKEISDLYEQIDKLGDITEEEEDALSSKERKERDNLHAALSAGAQELARLKSSIVSRMKALNGAKTMLSPADDSLTLSLIVPDEDEDEDDTDEELYSDLTPKLRDVLSDKAALLHSLSKWRRELNAVSEKINRVQSKRDGIRRRLLKSLKSPVPTKATRLLRSELRKQDDAMSSLLEAQATLLTMLTRLERDFRDLKIQEKVIADDWEERGPELYTQEEKAEQEEQKRREKRQEGEELVQRIKNVKEDIPSANVAFFDRVTKDYYEPFVHDAIAPNVPSVPKIDRTIEKILNSVFKPIGKMNELADMFNNNRAHRSSIRLVTGLYSMLVRSLLVGIGKENPAVVASYAEAASVCVELERAGLMKEAASLRDSLGFLQGKAKSALEAVQNTVDKTKDFIDKVQFAKSDTGPRRDPNVQKQESMRFYRQLKATAAKVRSRIAEAEALVSAYQEAGDEHNKKVAIYALTQLKDQLMQLEEQVHDLSSEKADAAQKAYENAERTPSIVDDAMSVMLNDKPDLIYLLKKGIPDSPNLERELLRSSKNILSIVRKLARISGKPKILAEYPFLHPAIIAYIAMFESLDDSLHVALRTN